jgi:hypothetical protein
MTNDVFFMQEFRLVKDDLNRSTLMGRNSRGKETREFGAGGKIIFKAAGCSQLAGFCVGHAIMPQA